MNIPNALKQSVINHASMNSWVLTVTTATAENGDTMSAIDVYTNRMKDEFWGLKPSIPNINRIKERDQVVFYLAGKKGQKFLGTASLASSFKELTKKEFKKTCHRPFLAATHGVFLADIDVWDEPISIEPLLKKLSITKGKTNWGFTFHNSIIPLPPKDLERIVGASAYAELKKDLTVEPKLTDDNKLPLTSLRRKALDATFHKGVRENYGYTCAICGKKRSNRAGQYEVESCHIYPRSKNGSNKFINGICLCRLHHWAFDNGLFTITDDYVILVEDRINDKADYEEIWQFKNTKIRLPKNKDYSPHKIFLAAHRELHK